MGAKPERELEERAKQLEAELEGLREKRLLQERIADLETEVMEERDLRGPPPPPEPEVDLGEDDPSSSSTTVGVLVVFLAGALFWVIWIWVASRMSG